MLLLRQPLSDYINIGCHLTNTTYAKLIISSSTRILKPLESKPGDESKKSCTISTSAIVVSYLAYSSCIL